VLAAAVNPPLIEAVDEPLNPVPVTLMVTAVALPAFTADGLSADTVGTAFVMEKPPGAAALPPPGAGFETPTGRVPAPCSMALVSVALSVVEETKVVGTGVPANVTTDVGVNPVPDTESATAGAPARADVGANALTVGAALRTLNENEAVPPPGCGFAIRPESVPGFAIAAAGRLNVMIEPEIVPGTPASVAEVLDMSPVAVRVTVVAPDPFRTVVGVTLLIAGAGLRAAATLKERGLVVPPPGGGLLMLTGTDPGVSALAGMTTVTDVVVRDIGDVVYAPNETIAFGAKLFPSNVSVTADPPAVVVVGDIEVRTGTPFCAESC
jgi:hypothetical protein